MRALALFARRPLPGRVKTRLSPGLPPALACDLHRAMVSDALAVLSAAAADRRAVYWDGPGGVEEGGVPDGVVERVQSGAGLGDRLAAAFGELLAAGDHAVVFGTDCPELDPRALDGVFAALDGRDLALRPARDGGYVAIGLAGPAPGIFTGIPWGGSGVLEATLARARDAGLRVRVLGPPLDDLDTPEDLLRLLARRAGRPAGGGALDRALMRMGLLPPA